jgi:DNA uptake protein ComE-like DNA-binding protein
MREALKGFKPSVPDVSAWLWWKSGTEKKPFPAEQVRVGPVEAASSPGEPEGESLEELEQRLEQAQIQIREAELRAATAEQQAHVHEQAEAELRERIHGMEQRTARQVTDKPSRKGARSQEPKSADGKPIALNEATFEQLRSLDLSVSQAARLIAQRDQRGGFTSLDELDGLYGMPREVIVKLRERTSV